MPIYEYQCLQCGHQLEALQKFSEEPLKDCPKCGQSALNKLVSAAGFQLKGSGWYVTDYSKKGQARANEARAAEKGESATPSDTSSTASSTSTATDSKKTAGE